MAADQSLGSMCPGLAEPRIRSELASADQCLKFCDDTPSAAMLPQSTRTTFTASNSPDLEQRLCVLAGWSACTPFTPQCRLAAFQFASVH